MLTRLNRVLRSPPTALLNVLLWLIGLVLAAMWFAPFVWMISTSLKPPKEVMTREIEWFPHTVVLDNYRKVFAEPVARWMFNSLVVAVVGTVLGVLIGALAGFALARLHFPGRTLIFGLLLASLMIPGEISIVPLYIAFLKLKFVNNYAAIILPSVASVLSVYIFRQAFLHLPHELEDAAALDGASHWGLFWRIALPLARAPMIAATILLFTNHWNAFLWPLLVVFDEQLKTLPVGLAKYAPVIGAHTQIESFGPAMAGATLLSIPSLCIFILLQNYFIRGVARTGIKG